MSIGHEHVDWMFNIPVLCLGFHWYWHIVIREWRSAFLCRLIIHKKAAQRPMRNMCYEPKIMIAPVTPECCPDKEIELSIPSILDKVHVEIVFKVWFRFQFVNIRCNVSFGCTQTFAWRYSLGKRADNWFILCLIIYMSK